MAKYFTSDYHLGHEEIINLCNRPWKNTHAMDKGIIQNHNSIIKDQDDVYFAGDLSLATKSHRGYLEMIIKKLKGRLHLVLGNHDIRDPRFWSELGIFSIHFPYIEVEEFIIIHDPSLSTVDRNRPFLCGHIHDLFTFQKNVLNVGVDVWGYLPVSINRVRQYFLDMEREGKTTVAIKYLDEMRKKVTP